ncbi:MAG TPA: hypothetical protein VLH10_16965 [Yinghuangia sp.]|uniref:hypothetical protein n=1 Tax=Yinghuangia sp. YIM S10712 TaxID=3436930 RepID=UPI002CBAA202|nr:hypothetical protein [Yinghuangia sp.]
MLAAALVCLLATSGVWLFSSTGGEAKQNDTAIGLNVPTGGVDIPMNTSSEGMTGPSPSGAASPTASASGTKGRTTSPTASKSESKSPTATTSSAPPPPPPPSQAPPPPPAPLPSTPTPSAPPGKYESSVNAVESDWYKVTFTIDIQSPQNPPTEGWNVSLVSLPNRAKVTCSSSRTEVATCSDSRKSANSIGPMPTGTVRVTFTIDYNWRSAPDEVSYSFNGVTTTVSVRD